MANPIWLPLYRKNDFLVIWGQRVDLVYVEEGNQNGQIIIKRTSASLRSSMLPDSHHEEVKRIYRESCYLGLRMFYIFLYFFISFVFISFIIFYDYLHGLDPSKSFFGHYGGHVRLAISFFFQIRYDIRTKHPRKHI